MLSTVAALATAAALLAPRPLGEQLDEETGRRLERAQHAISLFLKVNARQWMDVVAHDATDAGLVNSLAEATKGPADLGILHKTVQEKLRSFVEKSRVDLMLATDAKGRVIARAGLDDGVYKDFVDGMPLVADALRGLRGDDTWSLDGKLYRVAAAPVISLSTGRYAGVLVMGQEAGTALAQLLAQTEGVDVAFLLRGRHHRRLDAAAGGAAAAALRQRAGGHAGAKGPLRAADAGRGRGPLPRAAGAVRRRGRRTPRRVYALCAAPPADGERRPA